MTVKRRPGKWPVLLDKGLRAWIRKIARKNHWRVASYLTVKDLEQIGMEHFCRVLDRYGADLDKPHFVRLFQVTYINAIHDLARAKRRQIDEIPASQLSDHHPDKTFETLLGAANDIQTLVALFVKAPIEVKAVVSHLLSDAGQALLRNTPFLWRNGRRETTNQRLCRILGLDPTKYDIESLLGDYIYLNDDDGGADKDKTTKK